jgi:hypothetical protein
MSLLHPLHTQPQLICLALVARILTYIVSRISDMNFMNHNLRIYLLEHAERRRTLKASSQLRIVLCLPGSSTIFFSAPMANTITLNILAESFVVESEMLCRAVYSSRRCYEQRAKSKTGVAPSVYLIVEDTYM